MEKIAIIGMECLLPGYTSKDKLWSKLINGESLLTTEEYDGRIIERGRLMSSEADGFFKDKFSAENMQLLNEKGEVYKWCAFVVQEALKESGYLNNKEMLRKTGMVLGTLGMFVPEYETMFDPVIKIKLEENVNFFLKDQCFKFENKFFNKRIKADKCYIDTDNAKTISEMFGLGCDAVSMSAACATPLYAIKLGCMALESGKQDMMIVCSNCVNESKTDVCSIFDLLGIHTEQGQCNPLNKESQGLVISSGAGAVVLKRLNDAVKANDNILAVIDSIGWSNDGGEKSILSPCSSGQINSFSDAYTGGVSDDIDYIECHSTGTAAGDIEEYNSIVKYFHQRGRTPLIGTLKGSTGHFLTASAMGSIVKVILSMKNGIIPKTVRVDHPICDEVVTENLKWPVKKREKKAAINAFGFGGINAHLVLKEYRAQDKNDHIPDDEECNISVIGMSLQLGEIKTKEELFKLYKKGESITNRDFRKRYKNDDENQRIKDVLGISDFPKGAYIHNVDFDFMKYKFPVRFDMSFCKRDMLLINVSESALKEADLSAEDRDNTAVIINTGQDFSVLNFHVCEEMKEQILESMSKSTALTSEEQELILSKMRNEEKTLESGESITGVIPSIRGSRISHLWKIKGPSFVLTEQERAFKYSLSIARMLFKFCKVKYVIIGTVELIAETEFLYALKMNGDLSKAEKYGIGEGAAVIVLKREENGSDSMKYCMLDDIDACDTDSIERVRNFSGYSVSLEAYADYIFKAMDKYYSTQTAAEREKLLNEKANSTVSGNENKKSFIKSIPTNLFKFSERESCQEYKHKVGPEKRIISDVDYFEPSKNKYAVELVGPYEAFMEVLRKNDDRLAQIFSGKTIKKEKPCIWNRQQLIEMTGGSMSKILGDNYIQTDKHSVRSRMPLPPYMFVTRITKLNAEYGKVVPSSLEMEYDIDDDCVYLQGDNTISNVVYTEASQVGIFLGSYIGVDIVKDKALRFRVVDSKITFASERELKKGETLRLVYSIDKFTRRGDTVFANCTYSCYCGDEKILETIAIGGYFTEEDLCNNKGIINPRLKVNVFTADKGYEVPVKRAAKHYDKEHIEYYLMGDMRKCFNDDSFGAYQPQRGVKREVWMLDEVTDINTSGGKFGLGYIEGFKDVDESHWVFKAHFKNDPVMPGTLVLNGANQLFTFWSVYYGFYDANIENKPTVMTGVTVDVAFRGQVKCTESRIKYRIDIKKIFGEGVPYAVLAQVNVFLNDVNIIREDNVSMVFKKQ